MIRRNKKNSTLHSFVQNILPKCPNYLGAWCSPGALLFRPSPRLASTPAFVRKAPLPFQGEVLLVGLAGVRNVPAQRAGTLGPCAHAQSPDGRATLPRSLAFPPIPHVWLRPLPLYEKHPSLFRERCFWLGWQGSNLRCGSQSPMPYRLATAQYKKKRTLFCIKSALSLWGG